MIPTGIPSPDRGGPKTFDLESQLPRLPVPRLEDTCEKLLRAIAPFASTAELRDAETQVSVVLQPDSATRRAQAKLEQRQSAVDNYVDKWWTEKGYLNYRGQLAPVEGMALTYPEPEGCTQLEKAAYVMVAANTFYDSLLKEQVSVGGTPEKPVCMDQYKRLFLAHRVALPKSDKQVSLFHQHKSLAECHAVIICNGQHFKVELGRESNNKGDPRRLLNVFEARAELDAISLLATGSRSEAPLGTLQNGLGRTQWAQVRRNLMASDQVNRTSFEALESAAYVLCLDNSTPKNKTQVLKETAMASDPSLRCYDHCCQWIVFRNSRVGYTLEHSQMDAIPSFRVFDEVYKSINDLVSRGIRATSSQELISTTTASRMVFNLAPSDAQLAKQAAEQYEAIRRDWLVYNVRVKHIGKDFLKQTGLIPDALLQLSFQLAYFATYDYIPSVYESVATVSFRKGRTETCRSVSNDSVSFVKAFHSWSRKEHHNTTDNEEEGLRTLLYQATKTHRETVTNASKGLGIDRHLFALRTQLEEMELPSPELFNHPALARSSTWELSTSHVIAPLAMSHEGGVSFHPVSPSSTGIVYGMYKDAIDIVVLNSASGNRIDGQEFANRIVHSLQALVKLAGTQSSL